MSNEVPAQIVHGRIVGFARNRPRLRPVYVSMSRLRVDLDRSDELVLAFGHRAGLVESHDGFVDLQIWRSDKDPSEVLMVSRWRDRDAFMLYTQSSDHRASHDRMNASLKHAITLERLEHLHTYNVVAE